MRVWHIWILVVALVLSCPLHARPVQQSTHLSYVNDFANILDSASAQSIDDLAHQLEHWTDAQINVVTVQSFDGTPADDYALKLFNDRFTYPDSPEQNVLILFAVKEQHFVIVAGTRWQPILLPRIKQYEEEATPYIRQHEYGPAIALMTRRVAGAMTADAHAAQPYNVFLENVRAMITLCIIVVIIVAFVKTAKGRRAVRSAHKAARAQPGATPAG